MKNQLLPQIMRDFYCVALYSQLSRRSGPSESPNDHVSACYKLGEHFHARLRSKFHGLWILLRLYGYYHGLRTD